MAQQTEAACLLETGALYGTRIMLRPQQGDPVFAGFKAGAFSLYYGDEPIYHFDLEGRWQRAFVRGTHYVKGLDTAVQSIDRVREGTSLVLRRRTLEPAEAEDFDARVRSTVLTLLERLDVELERIEPPAKARPLAPGVLREFLTRVASWDAAAWSAHRAKYHAAYGPLPFLPPDCQNGVILQASLGNEGGVAYGLGQAAPHVVRSTAEFQGHARQVAELLGRRIAQTRAVFLGGSDVLRRPAQDVRGFLETIAAVFSVGAAPVENPGPDPPGNLPGLDGIDAFLDVFSAPRPDRETWCGFRALHLRRVTLGVESGDPHVRTLYRKRWDNDDLRATVADLKAAGLGVGVVVLVDAGGVEHAARHVEATARLINALELGPGDLVALLDGNELIDPRRVDPGFTRLAGPAWTAQQASLKQALAAVRTERGAKVFSYSLEKQRG